MPRAALSVEKLGLRISGIDIVRDVSLDVFEREVLAVIGPNGAGKTSLLNLLSGTRPARTGSIQLFGQDITKWAPHKRSTHGLGRTFQTSYLFLGLTVLENVRLGAQAATAKGPALLRTSGRSDPTAVRAMEALEMVGLAGLQAYKAGALSHGDRRKLELAMIVVADTKVALLDEPMAGVNTSDVDGLVELIRDMQVETGMSIVMVEHHMHVVLGLADRVAVMHHGALLACDVPERVMSDPTVQSAYLGEPL